MNTNTQTDKQTNKKLSFPQLFVKLRKIQKAKEALILEKKASNYYELSRQV